MVPNVAWAPQVVMRLLSRPHALTTQVDGSMHMLEGAWHSALCRHWVTPEHDSVADSNQPPTGLQASHDNRDATTLFVAVFSKDLHLSLDLPRPGDSA